MIYYRQINQNCCCCCFSLVSVQRYFYNNNKKQQVVNRKNRVHQNIIYAFHSILCDHIFFFQTNRKKRAFEFINSMTQNNCDDYSIKPFRILFRVLILECGQYNIFFIFFTIVDTSLRYASHCKLANFMHFTQSFCTIKT